MAAVWRAASSGRQRMATSTAASSSVLAPASLPLAERYVPLVDPVVLRDRLCARIKGEYARSSTLVLDITQHAKLLHPDPVFHRSIERRTPYVDPLSFIQSEMMRQLRQGGDKEQLLRPALLAINGIANGMKNTG